MYLWNEKRVNKDEVTIVAGILFGQGIYSLFPHLAAVRKIPNITKEDVKTILTQENPFCSKLDLEARKAAQAASKPCKGGWLRVE